MDKPKLTLIQGGKGEGRSRNEKAVAERKKSLYKRMTRVDRIREKVYIKISMTMSGWVPFSLKFWALGKLGALHGKYDYPSEDDSVQVANYR